MFQLFVWSGFWHWLSHSLDPSTPWWVPSSSHSLSTSSPVLPLSMSTALKQLERYKTSNSAPRLSLLIIILCSLMRGLSKEACAWTDISDCFYILFCRLQCGSHPSCSSITGSLSSVSVDLWPLLFWWLDLDWGDGRAWPTLCGKSTPSGFSRHATNAQSQEKPTERIESGVFINFI